MHQLANFASRLFSANPEPPIGVSFPNMFPVATVNNSVPVALGVFPALCSVGNLKKCLKDFFHIKTNEKKRIPYFINLRSYE